MILKKSVCSSILPAHPKKYYKIMEYKKISVLIVTYKQADVIGRNIESILQQKEFGLHEIIVCDDCSPDNNWEVIQSYVEKYPNIIRAYRNNPNLGIYGNSDKCASLHGDADLFCWLEGDDALEPGVFKKVQDYMAANNVNTNEAIGIFCDYSSVNPNGVKTLQPNSRITSGKAPLSLFIRGLVSWRASFFSQMVINKFTPTILNKGLALAEILFDSQWFRYVKKTYYCPTKGSIYFTEIGVSTQLGYQSSYKKEQALIMWTYLLENDFALDNKDINWFKFKILQTKCLISPSVRNILMAIPPYIKGVNGFNMPLINGLKSNFSPMIKMLLKK